MQQQNTKTMKTAEEAVLAMSDFVNNFGVDEKAFIEKMSYEHRTLQQSFTKLCLKWLEFVASDEYRFDGRNEASHKVAKDLLAGWAGLGVNEDGNRYDTPPSRYLPMI